MRHSTDSGNECTGINDGSKSSVLVTYLADAWNWSAEIFCGIDVSHLRRNGKRDGYVIYYKTLSGRNKEKRLMWVRAVSAIQRIMFCLIAFTSE